MQAMRWSKPIVASIAASVATLGVGCEPKFVPQPLPELVVAREPGAILVRELRLLPGESMIWDVSLHGLTIGRAELVAGADEVRSRFKTGGLAASVASVRHDLVTGLDRAAARAAAEHETLVFDGETKHFEATFD